jgi:hypothetical protein
VSEAAVAFVAAFLGAVAAFYFRRLEHRREVRINLYGEFLAAFEPAAATANAWSSLYFQLEPPSEWSRRPPSPSPLTRAQQRQDDEFQEEFERRRHDAWQRASQDAWEARQLLDVVRNRTAIVSGTHAQRAIDAAYARLEDDVYPRPPWRPGAGPHGTMTLDTVRGLAEEIAAGARREVWGRWHRRRT